MIRKRLRDPEWLIELKACLDLEEGLTDWELVFIVDLGSKHVIGRDYEPTPKQIEKLHQIWMART